MSELPQSKLSQHFTKRGYGRLKVARLLGDAVQFAMRQPVIDTIQVIEDSDQLPSNGHLFVRH